MTKMTGSSDGATSSATGSDGDESVRPRDRPAGLHAAVFLVALGVPLLAVNEGDAVAQLTAALDRRARIAVIDPSRIQPSHEGALVYATGVARPGTPIPDPDLQIQLPGLLLHRIVEVYHWSETAPPVDVARSPATGPASAGPTYSLGWSPVPIPSDHFRVGAGHVNPPPTLEEAYLPAADARLGAFALSPDLLMTLPVEEPVALDEAALPDIRAALGRPAVAIEGGVFVGEDPANPAAGDLRIRYRRAASGEVTLLVRQSGSTLAPPPLKTGIEFEPIQFGRHDLADLIDAMERPDRQRIWWLRLSACAAIAAAGVLGRTAVHAALRRRGWLRPLVERGAAATAVLGGLGVVTLTVAAAWYAVAPALTASLAVFSLSAGLALISLLPRRGTDLGR